STGPPGAPETSDRRNPVGTLGGARQKEANGRRHFREAEESGNGRRRRGAAGRLERAPAGARRSNSRRNRSIEGAPAVEERFIHPDELRAGGDALLLDALATAVLWITPDLALRAANASARRLLRDLDASRRGSTPLDRSVGGARSPLDAAETRWLRRFLGD